MPNTDNYIYNLVILDGIGAQHNAGADYDLCIEREFDNIFHLLEEFKFQRSAYRSRDIL